jgi:hypothetical protein
VKFIEANWRLDELSARSLDNLPNPIASGRDPYVRSTARRSAT